MLDYYQILGVSPTAPLEQIKARYRFLAQAYHPDKFSSPDHKARGESEFKLINEAFQTLSDPQKRRAYDLVCARHSNHQEHSRPDDGSSTKSKGWTISPLVRKLFAIGVVMITIIFFGLLKESTRSHNIPQTPKGSPQFSEHTLPSDQMPKGNSQLNEHVTIAWVLPSEPVTFHDDFTWSSSKAIFRQPTGKPELDWGLNDPVIASLVKEDYSRMLSGKPTVGRQVLLERNGTWKYDKP